MFPKHEDQGTVAMTCDVSFIYSFSHLFVACFKANRVGDNVLGIEVYDLFFLRYREIKRQSVGLNTS